MQQNLTEPTGPKKTADGAGRGKRIGLTLLKRAIAALCLMAGSLALTHHLGLIKGTGDLAPLAANLALYLLAGIAYAGFINVPRMTILRLASAAVLGWQSALVSVSVAGLGLIALAPMVLIGIVCYYLPYPKNATAP